MMSVFTPVTVPCPSCGEDVDFEAVYSVNADLRPDLRDAIIEGSFQRQSCNNCQATFRLDPDLSYLDVGRGQWFAVHPAEEMGNWSSLEEEADDLYAGAFGDRAPAAARSVGADIRPRMVFGWAALREKLVAAEAGLDDIELELVKITMLRSLDDMPIGAETELRLVGIDENSGDLNMAWILAQDESLIETLRVPRDLYDQISSDHEGWEPLRGKVSVGIFVDMSRLLVAEA